MQVVKRDGKIVDFDETRIINAIEKANKEVDQKERVTDEQIDEIASKIEEKENPC